MMELGRSAWIRRERLERIATAERDRRSGRQALAIAALGEAEEWPARAVLALCLLPESEGAHARRVLEDGVDQWALESGLEPLTRLDEPAARAAFDAGDPGEEVDPLELSLRVEVPGPLPGATSALEGEPPRDAFRAFQIELDRPIEAGELERAFAEAEAQVDEMHDVNRVAEGVLFDVPFDGGELIEDELDPLEESARAALAKPRPRPMDAATVPTPTAVRSGSSVRDDALDGRSGRPSRAVVLATLERWLQNLERSRLERMR